MKAPSFWYDTKKSFLPWMLWPLSRLFIFLGWLRGLFIRPIRVGVPVICVGNLVVGGAGKTPIVRLLVKFFKGRGLTVAVILRGYGGWRRKKILKVDSETHTAWDVGDEALMHGALTPTYIAKNRGLAAKEAESNGADVIILDDGLQNPSLKHDLRLCVIDSNKQVGNGFVLPAGPLRQDLMQGLQSVDYLVIMGEKNLSFNTTLPTLRAHLRLNKEDWICVRDKKIMAFAGIAHPQKFFDALESEGLTVVKKISFPDHYFFKETDIKRLREEAKALGAILVTTEKDWVRLSPQNRRLIKAIHAHIEPQDHHAWRRLLEPFLLTNNKS